MLNGIRTLTRQAAIRVDPNEKSRLLPSKARIEQTPAGLARRRPPWASKTNEACLSGWFARAKSVGPWIGRKREECSSRRSGCWRGISVR